MNIKIVPKKISGEVAAIASKSHAHRLLIASKLCAEPCNVEISHMNEDLLATKDCLLALNDTSPKLNCNESGSTLRFMLPIAMAFHEKASFYGAGRLPERPLSPLKEEMESHGCTFLKENTDGHIYTVEGRLTGGEFSLAGNVSSQYITGLLFALPLLKEDSVVHITSKLESIGYVNLTLEVLKTFGVNIEVAKTTCNDELLYTFHIKGGQSYISANSVVAEGDWSNGAFWVVANGVLSSCNCHVSCTGLNPNSSQGDKEIVSFVEAITKAKDFDELSFDVSDVPDLVPILGVLACSRKGITNIKNAARLRIKESDRLATVREMLENLGGNVEELADGLIISGNGCLVGGTVNGHNDHRIVMAATIASLLCETPVTILGAEAVNKSYPTFFDDFSSLGGEYNVL